MKFIQPTNWTSEDDIPTISGGVGYIRQFEQDVPVKPAIGFVAMAKRKNAKKPRYSRQKVSRH